MRLKRSNGQEILIEDTPFAKGGEGSIYYIKTSHYKESCVKLFHQGKLNSRKAKLDYMISHQLMAPTNSQYRICWPSEYVYDGTNCVGFIMPLAFPNSWSLYEIYLDDSNGVFKRDVKKGVENRYKLLYNIAQAINILHQSGYVLVDFKLQNILCSDTGQISMIDLDSIQICENSNLLYPATAYTIEYSYPKEIGKIGHNQIISSQWDCYSFSIVAYQTLLGIHPFTASTNKTTPSGENISGLSDLMSNNLFPFGPRKADIYTYPPIQNYFYLLPEGIKTLFVKTFDLFSNSPNMTDWLSEIYSVVNNKKAVENPFRATPKPPIVIFDNPQKTADGKYYIVNFICSYCDRIEYEGKILPCNKPLIVKNDVREILFIASNNYKKDISYKLILQSNSLYCIICGKKFEDTSDIYCTNCGTKRL